MKKLNAIIFFFFILSGIYMFRTRQFNIIANLKGQGTIIRLNDTSRISRLLITSSKDFPIFANRIVYEVWDNIPINSIIKTDKFLSLIDILTKFLILMAIILYLYIFKEVLLINILSFISIGIIIIILTITPKYLYPPYIKMVFFISEAILIIMLIGKMFYIIKERYSVYYRPIAILCIIINIALLIFIKTKLNTNNPHLIIKQTITLQKDSLLTFKLPKKNGKFYLLFKFFNDTKMAEWYILPITFNSPYILDIPFMDNPYLYVNDRPQPEITIINLSKRSLNIKAKSIITNASIFPQNFNVNLKTKKKLKFILTPNKQGNILWQLQINDKNLEFPITVLPITPTNTNNKIVKGSWDSITNTKMFLISLINKSNTNKNAKIIFPKLSGLTLINKENTLIYSKNYIINDINIPPMTTRTIILKFKPVYPGTFSKNNFTVIFSNQNNTKKVNGIIPPYQISENILLPQG